MIVAPNEIQFCCSSAIQHISFAPVVQYDTFAYFQVKVRCEIVAPHNADHSDTFQRHQWFRAYRLHCSLCYHHHKYKAATISRLLHQENLKASHIGIAKYTAALKGGLDQDGHRRLWQKWGRQPSGKTSDLSSFVRLSQSLDMATCKTFLHTHI